MNSIQIPIGISDFERIRENNYYYIDKSGLLIDMLKRRNGSGNVDHKTEKIWKNTGDEHVFQLSGHSKRQR